MVPFCGARARLVPLPPCRPKRPRLSRTCCNLPRRCHCRCPCSSAVWPGACARCVRAAPSTVLLARGTRACPWVLPFPLIPLPPTRPSATSLRHTPLLARVSGFRLDRTPPLPHPCRRRALPFTSTPRPPHPSATCALLLLREKPLARAVAWSSAPRGASVQRGRGISKLCFMQFICDSAFLLRTSRPGLHLCGAGQSSPSDVTEGSLLFLPGAPTIIGV